MSNLPVPTSHIPHFHLPRTALVLIDGAEYAVCSSDEHGHVMTRREAPQILRRLPMTGFTKSRGLDNSN